MRNREKDLCPLNSSCTSMPILLLCPILSSLFLKLGIYCFFFMLYLSICYIVLWIGISSYGNIIKVFMIKLCLYMKNVTISSYSTFLYIPHLIMFFFGIYKYIKYIQAYTTINLCILRFTRMLILVGGVRIPDVPSQAAPARARGRCLFPHTIPVTVFYTGT
jgi:hypothetical protein